ncbi:MAG: hypothetical protein JXR77_18155, partial [Lentisphaeria bacterium]|nr:hypothetical protein [Lentisphaeria bacterium]
ARPRPLPTLRSALHRDKPGGGVGILKQPCMGRDGVPSMAGISDEGNGRRGFVLLDFELP